MIIALHYLDYNISRVVTNWTANTSWHSLLVYFIAESLIFLYPVYLFWLWETKDKSGHRMSNKKTVMIAAVSLMVAMFIKVAINTLLPRSRPFVSHPDLFSLPLKVDFASFPSGHALTTFTLAFSLWFSKYRRIGGVFIALAILISIARVFAGVHYFSDIAAGALIGFMVAFYLHREASTIKKYLPDY